MHFNIHDITQLKHYEAMWCNGHKFHIKNLDEKMKTSNIGILKIFQVTNVSFRGHRHHLVPISINIMT